MYTRDFHKSIENDEYPQAQRLVEYIGIFMNPKCFLDFGCSTGLYLREFKINLPAVKSIGYEFSKDAVDMALCKDIIQFDLTVPLKTEKVPDTLGLCLEVLEHIDDSNWKPVLENITSHCDKLIFSAAVPGAGGIGHINCRNKIDWIYRFHTLGWIVDLDATKHMLDHMKNGYHMGWFAWNAMVLVPAEKHKA
jgi:SAM-dependent methyltransferase